ncbi:MAG: T9SS type A sorting domain-containing protein [Lentimicrobium sp.]|nr:T9SS type A sorting domain-containing protein [Lentimicrobium sp.]
MKTTKFNDSPKTRFLYLIILLAGFSIPVQAQMPAAITINPPNASAYDELTLTFDPAIACFQSGSLMGLTSIGMHSGVTFISGESWQNVINFYATGVNGQSPTLLPTGDGKYSITYTPAEFYGLTGQTVTQLCAVFNNGTDWSQDGRDFIPANPYCMDFFIPLNFEQNNPEFHFNLNMNKMIMDGNFNPLADQVFLVMDEVGTSLLTDENQDGIYNVEVNDGIELDVTYFYKFRINIDQYEIITREVTAMPGVLVIDAWWNDIPPSEITFVVDMNYQALSGNFNPETDFVDIAGTMNGWQGSPPMESLGNYMYQTTVYFSDPGLVEYKFRINGNWATSEFPMGGPNRMTWAIPESVFLYHFYDDYNPDTWPATFEVDMNAEINAGRFNPLTDYLDIAGTMNGWGAHQVLFDRDWTGEGIYTINQLINKSDPEIYFKFRINGNWETSEFPYGGPDRYWLVQDTTGGLINLYQCVYNITDIPYPPYVYNLYFTGELLPGLEIFANYTYYDPNADPEGESLYQWYVSDYPDGSYAEIIDGAVYQSYTITQDDVGRYLIFQVTPVAISGDPAVGYTAYIVSGIVGAVNTIKIERITLQVYPNPANEFLNVTSPEILERIEVYDLTGRIQYATQKLNSKQINIRLSDFNNGVYFVKSFNLKGQSRSVKFIKGWH